MNIDTKLKRVSFSLPIFSLNAAQMASVGLVIATVVIEMGCKFLLGACQIMVSRRECCGVSSKHLPNLTYNVKNYQPCSACVTETMCVI